MQIENWTVRLAGIISPYLEQTCETVVEPRPCGRLARTALRGFIRDRTVICIFHREAQQDIVEAECTVGGKDIAEWLVGQGCAVSADGARYAETMKEARQDGRGLWRDGADADLLLSSRRAETATSD